MKKINVINEDGTNILDNFPENPLIDKWKREYPMRNFCIDLEKNNLENYSCLSCGKCPNGIYFKIPKEDLKLYKKYLEEVDEYNKVHNPNMYKILRLNDDKHNN